MLAEKLRTQLETELASLFKRIKRRNRSSDYIKVDLHIHTVASKCYVRNCKTNSDIVEYETLIKTLAESDVSVFAITDHNTASGFFAIKKILEDNQELEAIISEKLLLPGVEVTCYNKHFLVIFPEDTKSEVIDSFLFECGVSLEEQGTEEASADKVSPLLLCEKVLAYGGIVILAHSDSEHGLLKSYFKKESNQEELKGRSVEKVLRHPAVYGVCYNSLSNLERLNTILGELKADNLAVLQASDSHSALAEYDGSGLPLGSRSSWVKLGKKSFRALQLALRNSNYAVRGEAPANKTNPYVVGLCVKGGFVRDKEKGLEWAVIPFSPELNCIIGARGTGKSTMMSILKFLLDRNNTDLKKEVLDRLDRFDVAVVFLNNDSKIFAICVQPESLSKVSVWFYRFNGHSFIRIPSSRAMQNSLKNLTGNMDVNKYLTSTNIQSYAQKEIFDLANTKEGTTFLLDTLCALQFRQEFKNYIKEIIQYRRNIIEQVNEIVERRKRIDGFSWTTPYLEEQYKKLQFANLRLQELKLKTANSINQLMQGKLKLICDTTVRLTEEHSGLIEKWVWAKRIESNIPYSEQIQYKRLLQNLFKVPSLTWALPYHLFTGKIDDISHIHSLPKNIAEQLVRDLRNKITSDEVVILPQMQAEFELNINYGSNNKELYRMRENLSFGQKAVGVLFLILYGATEFGENRPLFIDQPEDDLDNSYIYHILVKEFQNAKSKRQLIIATHNPNIPIAGDAENILVLNSNGENGWVECLGSIENQEVSSQVLKILEGDFEAFSRRAEKYGFTLNKSI